MKIIEETVITSSDVCIAIAIARFNNFINKNLIEGAIDTLKRIGQVKDDNITIVWVPGAYELPLVTKVLVETNKYNAVIALGTIIHGDTAHFKYIANSTSIGLMQISQKSKIPIAFGILITKNIEQSIERAGTKAGNKGSEAALTALEMINVLKVIQDK